MVLPERGSAAAAVPGPHWADGEGDARAAALRTARERGGISRCGRQGSELARDGSFVQQRRPELACCWVGLGRHAPGCSARRGEGVSCGAEAGWKLVRY